MVEWRFAVIRAAGGLTTDPGWCVTGLEEAELALKKKNLNAECHKW